ISRPRDAGVGPRAKVDAMRLSFKLGLIAVVLFGAGAAAYKPVVDYWSIRNRIPYRTAEVSRGPIIWDINSTGTVKPVLTVQVGSFISGPIKELFVDFNQHVK